MNTEQEIPMWESGDTDAHVSVAWCMCPRCRPMLWPVLMQPELEAPSGFHERMNRRAVVLASMDELRRGGMS